MHCEKWLLLCVNYSETTGPVEKILNFQKKFPNYHSSVVSLGHV
jgi:hypothetical protein